MNKDIKEAVGSYIKDAEKDIKRIIELLKVTKRFTNNRTAAKIDDVLIEQMRFLLDQNNELIKITEDKEVGNGN